MKRFELVLVGLIVALGTFLRFYHLPQTLLFLGDQGRDAIIAKHILKDRDIALIGPVTSVGNMYLGPFYYYFMVPFLALTYPDPVGPAIGVALVNSLAIVGLYWVTRRLINRNTALVATLLFALMPVTIQFSRFSWNPNIAAPAAIIVFWFLVRWIQHKEWKAAIGLGISLGLIVQLHYVALVTWAITGLNWLIQIYREKNKPKQIVLQGLIVFLVALAMLSPLVAFDFRHNHMISQKFAAFFNPNINNYMQPQSRQSSVIKETEGRTYQLLVQVVTGTKQPKRDRILTYVGLLVFGWLWITANKNSIMRSTTVTVTTQWLLLTIIGISFYSSSIFTHYLSYCLPVVALFWAVIITELFSRHMVGRVVGSLVLMSIVILCWQGVQLIPFNGIGTERIQQTVKQALPQVESPYNLALIAENGDFQGMNYRYFFEVSDRPPLSTDEYAGLKNLVVIDETHNNNPLSVAAFEIHAPNLTTLKTVIPIDDGPTVYIFK